MSRLLGSEFPDDPLAPLGSGGGPKFENVILMVSVDESSFPHAVMLSRWEVLAVDKRGLRVAAYADTKTTKNLMLTGKVTLVFVNEKMSYYVKGTAELRERMEKDPSNSMFVIAVHQVYEDNVPDASILGGISFIKVADVEPHEGLFSELVPG